MVTTKMENGKLMVTADASMFIIPNRAGHVDDFIVKEKTKATIEAYCSENGSIEFDDSKDWLIQVWMHSEDLATDNFYRHGFEINYSDEECEVFTQGTPYDEYIPRQLIDVKEGEQFTLHFANLDTVLNNKHVPVDLTLNVTAQQHGYRYGRFGNFEEVLNRVCD